MEHAFHEEGGRRGNAASGEDQEDHRADQHREQNNVTEQISIESRTTAESGEDQEDHRTDQHREHNNKQN